MIRSWFRLTRPFTLLPPAIGMLSGAASAAGSGKASVMGSTALVLALLGATMAAILNAASNVLNQIHDLELDRINKPERPLPAGELSLKSARRFALILYAVSIGLAFLIRPAGVPEIGWIVVVTAFLTWAYSGPPLRFRRSWWLAPLVIAIPRGGLLKVAGFATVASVSSDLEPWLLGGVFFLFLLGAASTKDFADVVGDRAHGVVSLPVRFGARRAAEVMAPFYVLPWLVFALLPWLRWNGNSLLSVKPIAGTVLGLLLALHGGLAARHLIKNAEFLADGHRGRAAWRHLYLLMMEAQIGIGLVYWI